MIATLDRSLDVQEYEWYITRAEEFHSCRIGNSPIEKRAKQLRQCGIGKRPHKASSFTEEEEEVLWKAKI